MLKTIFANPKRLFLCVMLLVAYGVYSGFQLPVSMYPATSKPSVNIWVPYGTYSADSFRKEFGTLFASRINKISNSKLKIDELKSFYRENSVNYEVEFGWNTSFDVAKKEIDLVVASISSSLPKEISDRIGVWQRNQNSGFFAASLYSPSKSLRELYNEIDPILRPELSKVYDAEMAIVWNPENYIISVRLYPEKLAQYGLYPRDVINQVQAAFRSFSGSQVKVGDNYQKFEIESDLKGVEDLNKVSIRKNDINISLKDIAALDYGRDLHRERTFKTDGLNSLILFARPKSGANVKKMSEDIMQVLKEKKHLLPKDLDFRVIVDPAEAINKSIQNLTKDVFVAALMAVIVLLLFIGGIKNVGTAVFEIPLSMILSFIFMDYIGMNLNLISLGGLALAAGMNVDASVVILENIFKHREMWEKQNKSCETFSERLELVTTAVKEVALPVILSISTTLIVFIPMAMTSDLTNAILGDLSKAVIFSHAISGFVALVIVPTVRVLVLKKYDPTIKPPMEKSLVRFQNFHERTLAKILSFKYAKQTLIITPFLVLGVLIFTLLPTLPKEVIGKPGSDWVYIWMSNHTTQSGRHMENIMQEVEDKGRNLLSGMVDYTWFERNSRNGGQIMFKLFNRSDMQKAKDILKKEFKNTPTTYYHIDDWNPAQLPLPEENHFKAVITGTDQEISYTSTKLNTYLKETNLYDRTNVNPYTARNFSFIFSPYIQRWQTLRGEGIQLNLNNIAEISQLTKDPFKLGSIKLNDRTTDVKLSFIDERYTDPDMLKVYPIRIKEKIIPLSALGQFKSVKKPTTKLVQNGQTQVQITAKVKDEEKKNWEATLATIQKKLEKDLPNVLSGDAKIEFKYPQIELKKALNQLSTSLLFSLMLIFFILWMQFQSTKQVLVIMMTIPLGGIGVILALYLFDSFLSLNSALGIILLNGITVNNSILLTDVTNDLHKKGLRGKDLVISATKKRLRPIIITSLTTILGMMPVALGMGDGGKILQPLGIAVTCGLLFATSVTIFLVPVLLYKNEEDVIFIEKPSVTTPEKFTHEEQPIL